MYTAIGSRDGKPVMWSLGDTEEAALDDAVRVWGIPRAALHIREVPQSVVERYMEGNYDAQDL